MLSVLVCPKAITLSNFHCVTNFRNNVVLFPGWIRLSNSQLNHFFVKHCTLAEMLPNVDIEVDIDCFGKLEFR
jgi:hypothetical protein